jgi:hypothetical protein
VTYLSLVKPIRYLFVHPLLPLLPLLQFLARMLVGYPKARDLGCTAYTMGSYYHLRICDGVLQLCLGFNGVWLEGLCSGNEGWLAECSIRLGTVD